MSRSRGVPLRCSLGQAAASLMALAVVAAAAGAGPAPPARRAPDRTAKADVGINRPLSAGDVPRTPSRVQAPQPAPAGRATEPARTPVPLPVPVPLAEESDDGAIGPISVDPRQAARSLQTVALFAAISLAPTAVLMLTAFVRINVVLVLLRQALGSPQVPGNQVLTALAVLLTALVMRPTGEAVYTRAVAPFAGGELSWTDAYLRASGPVKSWMFAQIQATNHERYLWELYDLTVPPEPGAADPVYGDEFPMRVMAPAYLLSELTTAMLIGFYLYLPFLVVDLVTAAVLSSAGLFMLPPSLVALPLKLILFVLADGWLHVATMLIQSFGPAPAEWGGGP